MRLAQEGSWRGEGQDEEQVGGEISRCGYGSHLKGSRGFRRDLGSEDVREEEKDGAKWVRRQAKLRVQLDRTWFGYFAPDYTSLHGSE